MKKLQVRGALARPAERPENCYEVIRNWAKKEVP